MANPQVQDDRMEFTIKTVAPLIPPWLMLLAPLAAGTLIFAASKPKA